VTPPLWISPCRELDLGGRGGLTGGGGAASALSGQGQRKEGDGAPEAEVARRGRSVVR
jgi:hypothetical protein